MAVDAVPAVAGADFVEARLPVDCCALAVEPATDPFELLLELAAVSSEDEDAA